MLTHLAIYNFTIIDQLEIDFKPGMTVLTGETGAGKSIIIDTLELVLGGRADNDCIRPGSDRCEIIACFTNPNLQQWLNKHDLESENECIVRRVISKDGRSRGTINGVLCPQQLIRELGTQLINIHGQHQHQTLLKKGRQRELLDNFAAHKKLTNKVRQFYTRWQEINSELINLEQLSKNSAQIELLNYQINELKDLALQENEIENLHQEYNKLNSAEELIASCNTALELLATANLNQAQNHLDKFNLNSITELIASASIQLDEAADELRHYLDSIEINPERLQQTEQRLNKIYDLARKHHVKAEELLTLEHNLHTKYKKLLNATEREQQLQQELAKITTEYQQAAKNLSKSRHQAAKKLAGKIQQQMQLLNMINGKFEVNLLANKELTISAYGIDQVEFLVTTNPGQPLKPLSKIVSGGELSRISLAIQVITAQQDITPTLIFDEVDVGIGGKTAHIVGQLLRNLGKTTQVMCVTHLPQVAAQSHNHLKVNKKVITNITTTKVNKLSKDDKIKEIARMLGGVNITNQTLAHAREMCDN